MRHPHEPSSEFVERLEGEIGREARRRSRIAAAPRWTPFMPQSRMAALIVFGLMLVSMGIGAAVVAASYEAQSNGQREQLASGFQRRVMLASESLMLATQELHEAERRVSVGIAGNTVVLEARLKVATSQAQFRSLTLQVEEVRITGREPRIELSSPRVSGRDFIGQRLLAEMSVPEAAIEIEQARVQEAASRFKVGMADALEVDTARARALEVEIALEAFRAKIEIRQKFLQGVMDATETELRVLEADAEQRRKVLAPKLDLARKESARVAKMIEVGLTDKVALTQATLRRLELETELTKADLDLVIVRRQIAQHRAGR